MESRERDAVDERGRVDLGDLGKGREMLQGDQLGDHDNQHRTSASRSTPSPPVTNTFPISPYPFPSFPLPPRQTQSQTQPPHRKSSSLTSNNLLRMITSQDPSPGSSTRVSPPSSTGSTSRGIDFQPQGQGKAGSSNITASGQTSYESQHSRGDSGGSGSGSGYQSQLSPSILTPHATSPTSQGTFILIDTNGPYIARQSDQPAGIGKTPKFNSTSGRHKGRRIGSGATILSVLSGSGSGDGAADSGGHRGLSGIWQAVRPKQWNGSSSSVGYHRSNLSGSRLDLREDRVIEDPVGERSRVEEGMTLGLPLGRSGLRSSPSNSSFMDLPGDEAPDGGQGQFFHHGHSRSKTEGSNISGHRMPLHSRLFPSHREGSPSKDTSYLEPFNSPGSNYSAHSFAKSQSSVNLYSSKTKSSMSPSISAPFGLSIASYRPIPTNTTLHQVAESMKTPVSDLRYLDMNNTVLIPAGKSDMQRQVEELEQKRSRTQSHSAMPQQSQGNTFSQRRELEELVRKTNAPGLLPLIPSPERRQTRQEQRDQEEEPVNWMQTALPRPTPGKHAAAVAAPRSSAMRWESRNACEQLVLPRPRLTAHVITPPGSPEKHQGKDGRLFGMGMGKGKERQRNEQVIVIGRGGKGTAFDTMEPPSPALSGPRVMLEMEDGRREREEWIKQINKGLMAGKRMRSQSAGSALKAPVYFVDEDEITRQGGWTHIQAGPEKSPPISKSFGFLHSGSTRSKSRNAASPGRLLALSSRGADSVVQPALGTRRNSLDNGGGNFGSLGRSTEDPLAAGVVRTPSHAQKRVSRNHSSPDLRRVFAGDTDDIVIMKGSRYRELMAGGKALPPVPAANQAENSPYVTLGPQDTVIDLTPALDHIVAFSHGQGEQDRAVTPVGHVRTASDPHSLSSSRPGRVAVRHPILYNSARTPPSRYQAYVEPKAEPPHPDSPNSPNFAKLDSQTAMALASRLQNSPHRKKTSIEEAVARARSSSMMSAPELPGSPEIISFGSPLRQPQPIRDGHKQILSAAGVLPTVREPAESVMMEKTPSGREVLSEAAVLALASPQQDRADEPRTPSVHLLYPTDTSGTMPSPAETVSPFQAGPMDQLGDNEQDLFYERPREPWSKPLNFPSPSGQQPASATRSFHDFSASRTVEILATRANHRGSKDSGITLPMSSPASMDSGRAFSSAEGISAENAVFEIATPLMEFPGSARRSSFPEPVTAPYDVAVENASDNEGFEVNHYPLDSSSPSGRANLDLFQSSPALTHNGSEEQYDYLNSPGHRLRKRSSENTSLRVRSVSSGVASHHRISPMDLAPSKSYNDLRNRASVTPMIVKHDTGATSTTSAASPVITPPVLPVEGREIALASTTPEKNLRRASLEAEDNLTPTTRLFQAHHLSGSAGTRSSASTPGYAGSRTSGDSTTFPIPSFPNPPGLRPIDQRHETPSLQFQPPHPPSAYLSDSYKNLLMSQPMQRMNTDTSTMTRETFVTAREGSDTD